MRKWEEIKGMGWVMRFCLLKVELNGWNGIDVFLYSVWFLPLPFMNSFILFYL